MILFDQTTDVAKTAPDIIKAASASPLGIFALIILILGVLAYFFFKDAPVGVRVGIFAALLIGAALYAVAITNAAQPKGSAPQPVTPEKKIGGQTELPTPTTVTGAVDDADKGHHIDGAKTQSDGATYPATKTEPPIGDAPPAKSAFQYVVQGNSFAKDEDWDSATVMYRKAVQMQPDYALAHYFLGGALGNKMDWDDAIKEQREAISLSPNFAEAHQALGVALVFKDDWDGAIKEEREALRLKPNFPQAQSVLDTALQHQHSDHK